MMTYDVDGRNHTVGTNVGVSDPYPPPIVDGDWAAWDHGAAAARLASLQLTMKDRAHRPE